MTDRWDFYHLRVDDKPAYIMLDMGIAADAPMPDYAIMAYVNVAMRQPRADGLSSNEEFAALKSIEDGLSEAATAAGRILYVGRCTTDGYRGFYFYISDDSAFREWADRAMRAFPDYAFATGWRPDPQWGVYFDFLYPSARDRQRMANRDLREQLEGHGDHMDQPRMIDHFAYFPDAAARTRFALAVTALGFRVTGQDDDEAFPLLFQRRDRPDVMDDISIELMELARAQNGDYDGWGCPVV